MPDHALGRRIAAARRAAGMTQRELAQRLGVTVRSVQGWESGAVVPYHRLEELAAVCGQRRSWLIAGEATDARIEALRQALDERLTALRHEGGRLERNLETMRVLCADTRRRREERETRPRG